MVLDIILSEFLRWVLLLLWIQLKKKPILLNLKLKLMKSNNIWKIIIGAVSAALGYILNAIGLWIILLYIFLSICYFLMLILS